MVKAIKVGGENALVQLHLVMDIDRPYTRLIIRSGYRIRSIEDDTCAVAIAPLHTLPHGDDRAFSTRNRQALRWPENSNLVADIHTDLLKTALLRTCDSTDCYSRRILTEKSTEICTAILLLPPPVTRHPP